MEPNAFDVSQLLREKRSADLGETSGSRDDVDVACPYCNDDGFDLASLIEHCELEHAYVQRPVACPVCRRTTKSLAPHLLQHAQHAHFLNGYVSGSSSQPSTSRATCHSMEWGRVTCCSELSFCTTIEDEQEGGGNGGRGGAGGDEDEEEDGHQHHGMLLHQQADAESTVSATETNVSGSEAGGAADMAAAAAAAAAAPGHVPLSDLHDAVMLRPSEHTAAAPGSSGKAEEQGAGARGGGRGQGGSSGPLALLCRGDGGCDAAGGKGASNAPSAVIGGSARWQDRRLEGRSLRRQFVRHLLLSAFQLDGTAAQQQQQQQQQQHASS